MSIFFSYIHESSKIPTQIHTNSITDFSFRKVTSNTTHNFINPSKVENNTFFYMNVYEKTNALVQVFLHPAGRKIFFHHVLSAVLCL